MWLTDFFVLLSSVTSLIETSKIARSSTYHEAIPVNWTLLNGIAFDKFDSSESNSDWLEMFPHYGRIVGNVFVQRNNGNNDTLQDYLVHCNLEIMLVYFQQLTCVTLPKLNLNFNLTEKFL